MVGVCEGYTVPTSDKAYLDNLLCIDLFPAPPAMVLIPAGPFQMGNNNTNELPYQFVEYPEHTVYVSAFQADRCEVSNEQMRRVIQWAYDTGKVYADSGSVTNLEGDGNSCWSWTIRTPGSSSPAGISM